MARPRTYDKMVRRCPKCGDPVPEERKDRYCPKCRTQYNRDNPYKRPEKKVKIPAPPPQFRDWEVCPVCRVKLNEKEYTNGRLCEYCTNTAKRRTEVA